MIAGKSRKIFRPTITMASLTPWNILSFLAARTILTKKSWIFSLIELWLIGVVYIMENICKRP